MTNKVRPLFALCLSLGISLPAAFAQGLPPTNMGKFVHQPGDNQYQPGSQMARHGSSGYLDVTGCEDHRDEVRAQQRAAQQAVMPSYTLAPPPPPGPDVSIEPIAAEEPVPPPGFPPLPLALDLPIQMGISASPGGRGSWRNQSGGGGGGPAMGGAPQSTGSHQHYGHYEPGAWAAPKNNRNFGGDSGGGGGGEPGDGGQGPGPGYGADAGGGFGGDPGPTSRTITAPAVPTGGSSSGGTSNYYKVRTPPPIMRTDRFDTTTSGGTGKGAASAPTMIGSRGSGREKAPGLDDGQDAAAGGAPETPTATGVFQTQAEDLTLPDDEYTSRNFKDGKGGRYLKQQLKRGKQMGRQMLRQTGVPISF